MDEVTQEVFEVLVRRYGDMARPIEDPIAFIRGVVRFKAIEYGRKRRHHDLIESSRVRADEPTPSSIVMHRRRLGRLMDALQGLPTSDQRCLALFYFVGCARREVAEHLCVSHSQVEVRIARSRRRLKARMHLPEVCEARRDASTGVLRRWAVSLSKTQD